MNAKRVTIESFQNSRLLKLNLGVISFSEHDSMGSHLVAVDSLMIVCVDWNDVAPWSHGHFWWRAKDEWREFWWSLLLHERPNPQPVDCFWQQISDDAFLWRAFIDPSELLFIPDLDSYTIFQRVNQFLVHWDVCWMTPHYLNACWVSIDLDKGSLVKGVGYFLDKESFVRVDGSVAEWSRALSSLRVAAHDFLLKSCKLKVKLLLSVVSLTQHAFLYLHHLSHKFIPLALLSSTVFRGSGHVVNWLIRSFVINAWIEVDLFKHWSLRLKILSSGRANFVQGRLVFMYIFKSCQETASLSLCNWAFKCWGSWANDDWWRVHSTSSNLILSLLILK